MCNIYRGIQNTTYYVQHLWWNSKYNLLCVTFIEEFKIQPITYEHSLWNSKLQPIMCNIYRGKMTIQSHYVGNIYPGIENTTYCVKNLSSNTKYNLLWVTFIVEFKIQPITCNIYRGMQYTTYYV